MFLCCSKNPQERTNGNEIEANGKGGPGYCSPLHAMKGGREKIVYVPCVVPDHSRPDYLATIDVDPESSTYCQVIHRLEMPYKGDDLHHFGWNSCSSCHADKNAHRSHLILPALGSNRIYAVDVSDNPKVPKLSKIIEAEEVKAQGLSAPHTSHCLSSGEIMISTLGDENGEAKGNWLILDKEFNVKGKWTEKDLEYGYDFWYQIRHNVMISTEFGRPNSYMKMFNPAEVPTAYGSKLHVYQWDARKEIQTIELGEKGLIPLELRFMHNPDSLHGFVGCALSSNIIHFYKDKPDDAEFKWDVVVEQNWVDVEGWALPQMPPLISDILISLDDKFLYFSNWLRGDICQYDITDPFQPKLVGRVFVGGALRKEGGVKVKSGVPPGFGYKSGNVVVPPVKGKDPSGGPQMIQLSLDGKRLYVTDDLLRPWDLQFYPDVATKGSQMMLIDVDTKKGGLKINEEFLIDFGQEPNGPVLAHEVRYPGGDCSSDIWA
eukprot:TRINITY_DN5102_c0_g2_i5.p2 TRINITY_DN5102_c0_g2~~TRINITY_DN5102_c0_g2_i5.p2  ORF type:complete len:490 (+),score=112.26 TRINITY_DN5102_c0_g2_i5:106-1575(+)